MELRMEKGDTIFSLLLENDAALSEQHLKSIRGKLKQIMWLCKIFNKDVEIVYECEKEGIQKVMTKVWLTTSKTVLLKDGLSIPAANIRQVRVV